MKVNPEVLDSISSPAGFVESFGRIGGNLVVLDPWQKGTVDRTNDYSSDLKSRQVGQSFAFGCRGWSWAYLSAAASYLGVFTSYNRDDALEKIRYVDILDQGLPSSMRMSRITDRKMEIEWENRNRVISVFRPRGRAKADLMMDEFAYCRDQDMIYNDALYIMSRGGARIGIGSSPTGASGRFHSIMIGEGGKYRGYKRRKIPWWFSGVMVQDQEDLVRNGLKKRGGTPVIEQMSTSERVKRFGSDRLKDIFENSFLEDFQTEMECKWSDESRAFLSWLILNGAKVPTSRIENYVWVGDDIQALRHLRGPVYVGMDVGRTRNLTEFRGAEDVGGRLEDRFSLTLSTPSELEFKNQEDIIGQIMSIPNVRLLVIDRGGLGMQLAENAEFSYGSRAKAQDVSPKSKPEICGNGRMMLERGEWLVYPDKDFLSQLHSIKKVLTPSHNIVYDVDKNEKHHADKAMAGFLMAWGWKMDQGGGNAPQVYIASGVDEDELDSFDDDPAESWGKGVCMFEDFGKKGGR